MRCWLGVLVSSIVWGLAPRVALAQSAYLQPGDVAVTCVDTTGTAFNSDHIQITPLIALPAVTDYHYRLEYTAYEADHDGVFDEELAQNADYVDPGAAIAAGQPVSFTVSGLKGPNEQVFLFQGFLDDSTGMLSPGVLIWGFQISLAGGWAAAPMDGVSALPTSVMSASVGLQATGDAVFAYVGPTTGTRAALQAAIADPTNWMAGAACPTGFVVTDGSGGGVTDAGSDASDGGGDLKDGDVAQIDAWDGGDSGADQTMVIDSGNGAGGVAGSGGSSGTGGTTGTGGSADAGSTTGTGGVPDAGGLLGTGGAVGTGGKTGTMDAGSGGSSDAMVDAQSSDVRIDVTKPGGGCNCAVSGSGAGGPAASPGLAALLGLLWWRRRRNRQ
jgi:MYXO-CTERM domain-containing protein